MFSMLRQGLKTLPRMSYALAPKYGMPQQQFVRSFVIDENMLPFASPTTDFSFKKLFGDQQNSHILVSLLNSLLHPEDPIEEVTIIDNHLSREDPKIVGSKVDILCKTKEGKTIAVEMQQLHESYFLARSQVYMAKLIARQAKTGDYKNYHNKVQETYMLSIGKKDIFKMKGESDIPCDSPRYYEKTVTPMVQELGIVVPYNKMNWKFYELEKLQQYIKDSPFTAHSEMKEQWLNFLIECQKQTKLPEDVDNLIKEAYRIMDMQQWTEEQRILYWKQEADWELYESQLEIEHQEGIAKGRVKQFLGLLKFTQEIKKLAQETDFTEEQVKELLQKEDKDISLAASEMLGFDFDLLGDAADLVGVVEPTEGDVGNF